MKILIACEFSGIVRDAFARKGHYVISCDRLATEKEYDFREVIQPNHYQGDVMNIINSGFDMMIAFPPCTYLCVTGNKWFKSEFKKRFPDREKQKYQNQINS